MRGRKREQHGSPLWKHIGVLPGGVGDPHSSAHGVVLHSRERPCVPAHWRRSVLSRGVLHRWLEAQLLWGHLQQRSWKHCVRPVPSRWGALGRIVLMGGSLVCALFTPTPCTHTRGSFTPHPLPFFPPLLPGFACPAGTGALLYTVHGCSSPVVFCPSGSLTKTPTPSGFYAIPSALGLFADATACEAGR